METNIEEFIEKLSSKSPTPGGGGAASVSSAMGAALCSMVCELTIGKKKYKEFEEELIMAAEKAKNLQRKLLQLAAEDEVAFLPLSKAYSLPETTEDEKAYKAETMEKCLVTAAETPFESAKTSYEVILLLDSIKDKCSKLAISDVGVGAVSAKAGLQSAALNVFINTKLMKNEDNAKRFNEELTKILSEGSMLADGIYEEVLGGLKK